MSLCALASLANGKIDFDEIMSNFGKWCYEGEFTATGEVFDIGNTCRQAIDNYCKNKMPYDKCGLCDNDSNGNGSLMRINPFVLVTANMSCSLDEKISIIHTASSLTHAHKRSQIGCGIYAFVLWELLKNPVKDSVNVGLQKAKDYYKDEEELTYYERLLSENFANTRREVISSSGYIVLSLEAAIWCLLNTESYKDCILKAVNLGWDTDTIAAIAGGLAGALYGYNAIPQTWRDCLAKRDYIEDLCVKAFTKTK
jgi:ADP-ribosylglycohydrolase